MALLWRRPFLNARHGYVPKARQAPETAAFALKAGLETAGCTARSNQGPSQGRVLQMVYAGIVEVRTQEAARTTRGSSLTPLLARRSQAWSHTGCEEEYFPYGKSSDRRDERNRYRYIGVERDEATGFLITGPRTYDSVMGRFLQGDPVLSPMSPFRYSRSTPLLLIDSDGRSPVYPMLVFPSDSVSQPPVPVDPEFLSETVEWAAGRGMQDTTWLETEMNSDLKIYHDPGQGTSHVAFYQSTLDGHPIGHSQAVFLKGQNRLVLIHELAHTNIVGAYGSDAAITAMLDAEAEHFRSDPKVDGLLFTGKRAYTAALEGFSYYIERMIYAGDVANTGRILLDGFDALGAEDQEATLDSLVRNKELYQESIAEAQEGGFRASDEKVITPLSQDGQMAAEILFLGREAVPTWEEATGISPELASRVSAIQNVE